MREDPIFSGGVVKIALVLLVAAVLGVGAYALFGIGINVNLPDLPEADPGGVTNLQNTELSDTTIGSGEPAPRQPADPFTSASFGEALARVSEAAGASAQLTRLFINGTQTQFIVRRGNGVESYSVRADNGDLLKQEATISITGSATIKDFSFPLSGVKASAIDPMLASARKLSGAEDFEPSVLTLERRIPFGSRALEWTINAQGGGRYLLYRAKPDGGDVRNEGGEGTAIPPAAQDAQKLSDCIQAAGSDTDAIFACLDQH